MHYIAPHPLDALLEWIQVFSTPDRDDIAALTLPPRASRDITPASSERPRGEHMLEWIQSLYAEEPRRAIGDLISFIAALEFFVLHERGTEDGWSGMLAVNEQVRTALLQRGQSIAYVEPLSKALLEMPLKKQRWLKQSHKWRDLRSTSLSNDTLMHWLYQSDRRLACPPRA